MPAMVLPPSLPQILSRSFWTLDRGTRPRAATIMSTDEVPLSSYILTQIVEHLSPGIGYESTTNHMQDCLPESERCVRQQTLARLALVSRKVSAIALGTLWSYIDDLRDLLSVFPSYDRQSPQQVRYRPPHISTLKYITLTSSTAQRFRDIVTDADWTRFKAYAARVRSLDLGNVSDIHANVWTTLTRLSPTPPLPDLISVALSRVAFRPAHSVSANSAIVHPVTSIPM
ncbi:hypothetical protein NUW54_g7290 [Trametes sanguinea]|uniref:Uncharacterized protein n=1 Tax=Trametes sanguinea TaxID=158606 RepID=A0ACC1PLN4_9APHY|nr:hypothetical protein NUW54_g7290 [Trametes sanguinea]